MKQNEDSLVDKWVSFDGWKKRHYVIEDNGIDIATACGLYAFEPSDPQNEYLLACISCWRLRVACKQQNEMFDSELYTR
jgi:hypothetical protein